MTFKPGKSGNPAGKPKGAKDKRTELRNLLKPHAPALVEKAVKLALEGDVSALKLCLDRIIAPMRDNPISGLRAVSGGLTERAEAIFKAVADGDISPSEAKGLIEPLTALVKAKELDELERRVSELEEKVNAETEKAG